MKQEDVSLIARQMRRFGARGDDGELAEFARRALEADMAYAREVGADEDPDAYDEDDACEAILAALEGEDGEEPDEQTVQTRLMLLDAFMEALSSVREAEDGR